METITRNINIIKEFLNENGEFPNNSMLPVVIYKNVITSDYADDNANRFENTFRTNKWVGAWRNGIYDFHHYHSTAHEVLGIYEGSANIQLGGPSGPVYPVIRGDVIIIPAGVAHKNLGSTIDFGVVGAYPQGQDWDMKYGNPGERPLADTNIARVSLPLFDPVFGDKIGFLTDIWNL